MSEAPPLPTPSPESLRRARTFWEQGLADLQESRRRMRAKAWLDSSYLSFQASINALSSVCTLHGEFRLPNHSTGRLAALAQGYDPRFAAVGEPALALEEVQELNPYAPERDTEDERRRSRLYYAHSDSILKTVRGYLKAHRKVYFNP